MLRTLMLLLAALLATPLWAQESENDFPLQNGDVWVMAGDSITAQHLHSNFFEAFCFARYPDRKFAFRNSGVGGHTIPTTLARFDYDIGAWRPTVVSVELGMNDKGSIETEKYLENMKTMVERIRSIRARPIIFAASPVNNGETLEKLGAGNQRLNEYATALKDFCDQEKIPYADQFHALIDVWGKNKPREVVLNVLGALQEVSQDESVAGSEHLRSFLAAQEQSFNKLVSMQGDPVHPGPPGQLMMAAALLKLLNADGFVSSAELDASGKLVEAKGCQVDGIQSNEGTLAFDRLDERLPFPIPDDARAVLGLDPTILELSQYTLKVTGLKEGPYTLKIDGATVGTLPNKVWEEGVNLTAFGPAPQESGVSPLIAQSRAILGAVAAKELKVKQWRDLSQRAFAPDAPPQLKDQLAVFTKTVEAADNQIRNAARPKKMKFELVAAEPASKE